MGELTFKSQQPLRAEAKVKTTKNQRNA
ncbi:uncharacterized protein G2W53_036350 [Senna tora]|uniref:Uncharacterized protein n=1 Tax=Senna tora TaxID=362788 RepID=A0A834STS7_9FABA|nr:uncharacterized protein G2W53_036350 [Senna tora]